MTSRQIFARVMSLLCVTVAWYFDVWWLGTALLLWHCYHYRAYEIIVVGILIDAEFMLVPSIPWYTVGFGAVVIVMEFLKPLMRSNRVSKL